MQLTAKIQLRVTPEQRHSLLRTLRLANQACNWLSAFAFDTRVFSRFALQKKAYRECRNAFPDLASQTVIHCCRKVADSYKLDRTTRRAYRDDGAIPYDARILSFNLDTSSVSIWTLDGRLKIEYAAGERQRELLRGKRGESDLCYIDGRFYLFVACVVDEPVLADVCDYLGVDMGIVQIATDSDGDSHSGGAVEKKRRIYSNRRARLQKKGTKSDKRKLRQIRHRQSRFQSNENHRISKTIVRKAQDTGRGIALEELGGIRERVTVRKPQRARLSNWAFFDLRLKIEYKARRVGIPVVKVDPRNTSRTCHACGCIDKANRRSQSHFECVTCGHVANADHNAALNIRSRAKAAVNRPNGDQ